MLKMVGGCIGLVARHPSGTSPAHERQRQAPIRVFYDVHRRSPRLPVTVTYPLITYPLPIRYRWTAFDGLLRYFNDSAVEDLVLNYLSPAAFAVRPGLEPLAPPTSKATYYFPTEPGVLLRTRLRGSRHSSPRYFFSLALALCWKRRPLRTQPYG